MIKTKSLMSGSLKTQQIFPKFMDSHLLTTVIVPQPKNLESTASWVYIFWVQSALLSTSIAGHHVLRDKKDIAQVIHNIFFCLDKTVTFPVRSAVIPRTTNERRKAGFNNDIGRPATQDCCTTNDNTSGETSALANQDSQKNIEKSPVTDFKGDYYKRS